MTESLAPTPGDRLVGALDGRMWWSVPLIVGLATAALAEIAIGRWPLQAAEAGRVALARHSLGAIWGVARTSDAAHLTTTLAWKPWLAVVGSSEEAIRYPSVLCAALAATLTVLIGKELLGWLGGAVAGAAVATNGLVLVTAQHADAEALGLLLVTAATYVLLRAAATDHAALWALYAVLVVATATASLAALAVVAAHLLYLALPRPRGRPWRRALPAYGGAALGVAAYLVLLAGSDAWRLDWLEAPDARAVGEALWEASGRNAVLAVGAAAGLAALLVPRLRGGRTGEIPTAVLLVGWLLAPVAATLLTSLWRPAFAAAYLVVLAPPLALLAGAAVAAAARRPVVAAVAAAALAVGAAVSVTTHLREDAPADWRAAARYVALSRQPGEDVLVAPHGRSPAFRYYAPDAAVKRRPASDAVWVVASGSTPRAIVIAGRTAVGAPAYALLEERPFGPELTVQRWVRP